MISFRKWLEFSDQGGEVSYNHVNNVVAGDGFEQLRSKYMASSKNKIKDVEKPNVDRMFGKKRRSAQK